MEITIVPVTDTLPVERAFVISMVIKSFKGRRDVEVHLFHAGPHESELETAEGVIWDDLVDSGHPKADKSVETFKIILEAFTEAERDQVIEYLKNRYEGRVSQINACTLSFPIPQGMPPLSAAPEGKTIGFIRFESTPHYTLPFTVHGLYDLSQHEPLVQE